MAKVLMVIFWMTAQGPQVQATTTTMDACKLATEQLRKHFEAEGRTVYVTCWTEDML